MAAVPSAAALPPCRLGRHLAAGRGVPSGGGCVREAPSLRAPRRGRRSVTTSRCVAPRRPRAAVAAGGGRGGGSREGEEEGAGPGWSFEEPKVYYFAIANAQSLACDGILLEEILRDATVRADRARRPRDVWLVMEPAFLASHPNLAPLSQRLQKPTAAIVTTNGDWMLTIVKPLLPQAVIGKFKAPTKYVKNPVESLLNPAGAVIGGGAVWH